MARNRYILALVIFIIIVIVSGCIAKEPMPPTIEDFSKFKIGTQREYIHEKFGQPSGGLSGMRGRHLFSGG